MKKFVNLGVLFILLAAVLLVFAPACKLKGDNGDNGGENGADTKTTKYDLWLGETKLRGANIYQRRVYPELDGHEFMGPGPLGPPYIQEDFDNLAASGANYVNISHPGIYTEKPPYKLDNDVLQNITDLVNMIGKADMFAVISFRTGPGRSEFTFFWGEAGDWFDSSYYNDRVWKEKAARDAWAAMWKETAKTFAGNPYVVGYDLMVEPNSNDVWLDTWDAEEFYDNYGGSPYDWNAFFPRISTAIREVDRETPLLIGGMSYSMVDWLPYVVPTPDEKTVYMVHQYEPSVYTHQDPDGKNKYPGTFDADYDGEEEYVDKNWLQNLLTDVDDFKSGHNVPVSCNEFGGVRWVKGIHTFMDDLMSLFEVRNMNYALWMWSPLYKPLAEGDNAFNFRFGPNPGSTVDVPGNALLKVIKKYWEKNSARPSNTTFTATGDRGL
jgi:hypothetical protein